MSSPRFAELSFGHSWNLGDQIQAIAASRYLPRVDALIDRDELWKSEGNIEYHTIFNGWFLHGARWPPPPNIHPLMLSFYADEHRPDLVDPKHLDWYRRHEPVGCRSLHTLDRLSQLGVESFFSGCLSLTLDWIRRPKSGEVLFVDADEQLIAQHVPQRIVAHARFVQHVTGDRQQWLRLAFERQLEAWTGQSSTWPGRVWLFRQRHRWRMATARRLLDRYAAAKLVVTSRLHCFLPCLALGTPVVLLLRNPEDPRFRGLAELGTSAGPNQQRLRFDWDNPPPNPTRHRALAASLTTACVAWRDRLSPAS